MEFRETEHSLEKNQWKNSIRFNEMSYEFINLISKHMFLNMMFGKNVSVHN